jgi:high-affinity iron transporter
LISLIAAGMAAQAVGFLDQANIVTALDRTMWDTSWLLADDSWVGRIAHTLLGYTDQPTELQLIVYIGVLATIFVLMKLFAPPRRPVPQLATGSTN